MSCKKPSSLRSKNKRALTKLPTIGISRTDILPDLPAYMPSPVNGWFIPSVMSFGREWVTLWACQAFSTETGCLILRGAELCRLELNSSYHSYYFIYKSKPQLLGLLWGPFLSNTDTKNPTKVSKHQQNLIVSTWHMSGGDWALCRSLPVQTGILS